MREVGSSYCSSSWRKLDADDTDRVPLYSRVRNGCFVGDMVYVDKYKQFVRRYVGTAVM